MNIPSKRMRPENDQDSRYRQLIDAITDYAIYMLDIDGYVTSWNAGARRFKGYEAAEIIGQHFSRFYIEEDRSNGVPQRALQIAAGEGRFEQEGWRVRKDGTRFVAHVIIDPIRDPSGSVVGFAKITRDLTERHSARQALLLSEDLFRRLVQGVTDYAIYMLDPQGLVTSWNAGAERIKGYAESDIVGRHFSIFYTQQDRDSGLPQKGLDIAAREGRFEIKSTRLRKDGTQFMAHVVIDAIRDEVGSLIGFAKVTRDITERQSAQEALQKAQQTLFQTQKLESIGQLTGGIAHDFNNLLTAIGVCLELVLNRLPQADAKSRSLLQNAMSGVTRGTTLTQRMLAFARRQELSLEAVSIATLLAGLEGLLTHAIGPSLPVQIDIPSDLPFAFTDPNQLETALINLAINARDAMPDGGTIKITARAIHVSNDDPIGLSPGTYICVSVSDKGYGMDAQTLAKATEPFFTTKGVGKGTGLGLSMVHGLAEQSGGKLRIKSEPERGTTVDLILPMAGGDLSDENKTIDEVHVTRHYTKGTILIVDDDPLVLTGTVAVVEDMGYTVIEAGGGAAALEILAQRPDIDLVITDQLMPNMTGMQLAKALFALRPELPIVLATGYAELDSSSDRKLRRISKPFTRQDLAETIRAALADASSI
jgi:PAS domain S-box-containing protein